MRRKVVLIAGLGGDIGQGIIKCLNEINYDLSLIGCDMDPIAASKEMVERFYQAPAATESGEYVDFIKKLVDTENVDYIFPISEKEISVFNKQCSYFHSKNVIVLMNRHDIIETFFDKYKTVEFLKNNDLPHPKTYLLEDYNDELEFPFLLKPRKNRGGRGIMVINDSDELNLYRKRVKNYIAQEIVGTEDEEYTVTVFSNEKEYFSIAFKRYLGCGSLTRVAHVIYDDSVKFLAERIARASLLRGSLNIQCRKIGTKYIPFEINPRFSSTVYTRHCFGFQDAKWWIDLSEGRKIGYVPKYKEGTVVRNIGEVFFNLTPW